MASQIVLKQGRDSDESKGQHLGKAPSQHLFRTTVRQCMGVFLKNTTSSQPLLAIYGCSLATSPAWPGNEASMTLLVALCYTSTTSAVSCSRLQIYDCVLKVHGMVLASSAGRFPSPTCWLRNEANMI